MNKRIKRGCILVVLGLCMVMTATAMYSMYEKQDELAGQNATVLLRQLKRTRVFFDEQDPDTPDSSPTTEKMPEVTYSGYSMIGILRIPTLEMELPILSQWSYELLDIAPCRYSGSLEKGNLILMGHNYVSHFHPLHLITVGTAVEFEDVSGKIHHYVVEACETLHKTQDEDLPSEYPLSIFTCTTGGQSRLVVRCSET